MVDLNEAIQKIKQVGASNARAVPMAGQSVNDGNYQIEICENGNWRSVVSNVKKQMAEDIIQQAVNRVILG
jgi:hypothetical protein